MNTIQTG